MRKATRKDVLYALQFGHERLIKTIVIGARTPDQWCLSKTGLDVPAPLAREVVNDPHIHPLEDGLFPGMSQQFEWREVA